MGGTYNHPKPTFNPNPVIIPYTCVMAGMKLRAGILILISIIGCTQEGAPKKRTAKKSSESEVRQTNAAPVKTPMLRDYKSQLSDFIQNYLVEYDTMPYQNEVARDGVVLNESEYLWSKKLQFKQKKGYFDAKGRKYFKRFELISYTYADSSLCGKAFHSWLNNFGTMGIPVKEHEYIKAFHSSPFIVVRTPKEISALFMSCEYLKNDWESI